MSERDDEHWYPSLDNPNVLWPSVTTILGTTTAKRQLEAWSAREAVRFAIEHHRQLAELVSAGHEEEAIRLAAREPRRIAGEAAAMGRLFHRLAEALVKGSDATCTDEEARAISPFLDTLDRFVKEMDPTYHWAEATVYHDELCYAGTCDCGVEFARPVPVVIGRTLAGVFPPGTLLCGDYKTGKRVWPEAAPQLVGYGMCTHLDPKNGGPIVEMPETFGGVVIHIRPDAYRVHGVMFTPEARAGWAHARHWFDTLRSEVPATMGSGIRGDGIHLDDIKGGLNTPVRDVLALEGVFNLAALEKFGEDAFGEIPGVGPATVEIARQLLALEGRAWPAKQRKAAA